MILPSYAKPDAENCMSQSDFGFRPQRVFTGRVKTVFVL